MGFRKSLLHFCVIGLAMTVAARAAEAGADLAGQARAELFAARYENAAKLYGELTRQEPASGDAWFGLVRAEMEGHHHKEAVAAADEAVAKAPQTAGAETAAGLAEWRQGSLNEAEVHYRAALKLNPNYPGALEGMATVYSAISKFRTARALELKAWSVSPDDPELMIAHADTLKGAEHFAALEAVLPLVDASSDLAAALRAHLATDRAISHEKARELVSPYQSTTIPFVRLLTSSMQLRGYGLRVQLNGKTFTLELDTGASGISITPKMAERAGLRLITSDGPTAKGIGNAMPLPQSIYLASEVHAGDVKFANYPIHAFASAASANVDGLIGLDVFQQFITKVDFIRQVLALETRAGYTPGSAEEPVDRDDKLPAGFYPLVRFGNHMTLPTSVNGSGNLLFLLDSGSAWSIIDADSTEKYTRERAAAGVAVRGVQGTLPGLDKARFVTLTFAGMRQQNAAMLTMDMDRLSDDFGAQFGGILGMPVLYQLAVTIDYRQGIARFEHK